MVQSFPKSVNRRQDGNFFGDILLRKPMNAILDLFKYLICSCLLPNVFRKR